jgi:hypothetical protein
MELGEPIRELEVEPVAWPEVQQPVEVPEEVPA